MNTKTPESAGSKQDVRDTRGRFRPGHSGNPAGLPRRTPTYRKALDDLSGDAFKALAELVKARDPQAVLWVCGRLIPPLRPRSEAVPIEIPDGDPAEQVRIALAALAAGRVSIDETANLLGALRTAAEITSVSEMRAELDELREKLG